MTHNNNYTEVAPSRYEYRVVYGIQRITVAKVQS